MSKTPKKREARQSMYVQHVLLNNKNKCKDKYKHKNEYNQYWAGVKKRFLAVQDSSIGDIVTHSLTH